MDIKKQIIRARANKTFVTLFYCFLGILLFSGIVIATTTITETTVTAPVGSYTNITADKINVSGFINSDNFRAYDTLTFLGSNILVNSALHTTAIGYSSCYNCTAPRTTAVGYYSGYNSSGSFGVLLGYYAGNSNTAGNVVAIGDYAGSDNIGANLVAIGSSAGEDNTGDGGTFVGELSGNSNTGAIASFFGNRAGISNTGSNVVGIGYQSLQSNTASNVVAIGYQAGLSNSVADQFIVKQTNINAIPLIQGNFSSGNVGIGTTNPSTKLDVNGNVNISGGNLSIQQKITFALGEIIDNLVDGWIRITGSLNVTGYTSLGSDAPIIKMKKLTGTTDADDTTVFAHGLNRDKILSASCLINATQLIPPNYATISNSLHYTYYLTATNIEFVNVQSTVQSKTYRCLITYEE